MKKLATIVLIALAFSLNACKGPEGPAGPQGLAGKDGKDGLNGKDGANAGFVYFDGFKTDLKCATCHTPDIDTTFFVAGKVKQWENSTHGNGTAWSEYSSGCAECHTTEAYQLKQAGKPVTDILNPTPPGCFACHKPHSTGDFSLRTTTPVALPASIVGVADATFDLGKGNLCASCHRPRTISPMPDPTKTGATDSLVVTNNRWYTHYGVQSQMLTGVGAFQFTTAATYTKTAAHSSGVIKTDGCVTCHMENVSPITPGQAYGAQIGGHTMKMEFVAHGSTTPAQLLTTCKTCHTSITKFDYNGKQTAFQANMDTLKSLLVAKGWIDNDNGILATSAKPIVFKPAARAGILMNYMTLLHDGSNGVHNPAYMNDIVRASIVEARK